MAPEHENGLADYEEMARYRAESMTSVELRGDGYVLVVSADSDPAGSGMTLMTVTLGTA